MIRISKLNKSIFSRIPLTPSKSISNRILIIRALCENIFEIKNLSGSTDTKILNNILNNPGPEINVFDAGTACRFLTAFLSFQDGEFYLSGSNRMKKRPIGKLVKALRSLGASIEYPEEDNFLPLKIIGKKLRGGKIQIQASESSQYISAILMLAPLFSDGLEIELTGKIFSKPYILMTISLMKYFGSEVIFEENRIIVPFTNYRSRDIEIENDWSSASFWYQAAVLSDVSEIELENLNLHSVQGDVVISEIMKKFNVMTHQSGKNIILKKAKGVSIPDYFEYDFASCPDLLIPVAFTCAALKVKSNFTGIDNLRIKESDRIVALKTELTKMGCRVSCNTHSLALEEFSFSSKKIIFQAYSDHRMVMSESLLSLVFDEIEIDDFLSVSKSYPEFWDHLKIAGFTCNII